MSNSITFDIKYKNNSDLVLSPKNLKDKYFFGIDLSSDQGTSLSDDDFEFYIKAAQREIEEYLNVRLKKQVIFENQDFINQQWKEWGYIKCTYPVNCALQLEGFLNKTKQVTYPSSWLSTKKIDDDGLYHRNLYLVPAGDATQHSEAIVYSGIVPQLGYLHNKRIPNYWNITYVTGFDEVPHTIINAVGKLAAINIFHELGDIILSAGIASKSIGIDGLSQSISSSISATNSGYGARIINYHNELKRDIPRLKDYYRGFSWMAV